MSSIAPICFFCYNRPKHMVKSLNSLLNNDLAASSLLYVFSDGPRVGENPENVNQVRKIIDQLNGFGSIQIIKHETNIGTLKSVTSGISQVLDRHTSAIIVEDDILVSEHFLEFMNNALDYYCDERKVMSVSSFVLELSNKEKLPDTFFYRKGSSYGWGTWTDAWSKLNLDCKVLLDQLQNRKLTQYLDGEGLFKISDLLLRDLNTNAEKAPSWSPRWYASMILEGGLTLYPKQSLSSNIGFDGSGLRSPTAEGWNHVLTTFKPNYFPDEVKEQPEIHNIMTDAYEVVNALRGDL